MPIDRVAPGEAVTTEIVFIDSMGEPTGMDGIVEYRVMVGNRQVLQSTATPDLLNPALYIISFNMPANVPVSIGGEKASLIVWGRSVSGDNITHVEHFHIIPAGDDINYQPRRNIVVVQGASFSTTFSLPKEMDNTSNPLIVSFHILDENGNFIASPQSIQKTTTADEIVFRAKFPNHSLAPANTISGAYLGRWDATAGNLTEDEVETVLVYCVNNIGMIMLKNMEAVIDKAQLKALHPYLEWDAATLIQHLMKGYEYVNSAMPRMTNFSLATPQPVGLTQYIEKAGIVSALRAQYLAEGQSTFDFQGLGVQLNVDRLAPLQELISQLSNDLERLPEAKKNWLSSGGPVSDGGRISRGGIASGVTVGAYTNFVNPNKIDPSFGSGDGARLSRVRRGGSLL